MDEITKVMPMEDLMALVKGLTVVERFFNWTGGSVSSVIWTFREVERRNIKLSEELANWILARTRNPYVPFGRHNHGARSVAEYRSLQSQHQEWTARRSQEIRLSEEQAKKERSIKAQQRSEAAQVRNSEIRKSFLKQLDLIPIEKQLEQLAFDPKYPVEFYPTRIPYQTTPEIINNLNVETRKALFAKLKGRHRGPWQRFKQLLTKNYPA